ncbi:Alpha/Beta hydrolase protein [Cyathus striatus]|nr:Alpha/Beta hydrolase protein [Cyathus striatus]
MSTKRYAGVSVLERITLTLKLLRLPFVLSWAFVRSPFSHKTWKRVVSDQALRTLVTSLSIPQLQVAMGTTDGTCTAWSKSTGIPIETEELGDEGRLHWVKSKQQTKKVIIYIHSGGFIAPVGAGNLSFLRYLQGQLGSQGKFVNIAILRYSLVPERGFPTPLKQLILAIERLVGDGIEPSDIYLIGDSAGGNLILQLFSHLLHPHPSIPRLELASPIRAAYLMSPWVTLVDRRNNMSKYDVTDVLTADTINYWGNEVLKDVPEDQLSYAEPNSAPTSWWEGVDKLVDQVLISVGGAECLKDETVLFADTFKAHHKNSRFIVQTNGLHIDPMLNFIAAEKKSDDLTTIIVEWFSELL